MGVLLSIKEVSKVYNECRVLDNVSFDIHEGTIHAFIGANGSGKSTLMSIISGNLEADQGTCYIRKQEASKDSNGKFVLPNIELVGHDNGLIQEFNTYENMFIGCEPTKKIGFFNVIDWSAIKEKAKEILWDYGIRTHPNVKLEDVPLAQQKLIELVCAVARGAECIILDEPTLSMNREEEALLLDIIKKIKEKGIAIVYVSHKYKKVEALADIANIIVDGKIVLDVAKQGLRGDDIKRLMFSSSIKHKYPKRKVPIGDVVLQVENMYSKNISDISFNLKEREIIGFAGLKGSYSQNIIKALFGIHEHKGNVYIDGRKVKIGNTEQALKNSLCYIGSIIEEHGLFMDGEVYENITAADTSGKFKNNNYLKKQVATYYMDLLNINPGIPSIAVKKLSMGNKKKVLIAKWLLTKSRFYLFNFPTTSLDAAAKVDVYNLLGELVENGASIVMVSHDSQELLGMCDRIYITNKGRITREVNSKEISEVELNEFIREE